MYPKKDVSFFKNSLIMIGGGVNCITMGFSIVVPYLNEESGIELFCKTVDDFAKSLSFPVELVFVDDGSTDNTNRLIVEYGFESIGSVKLVELSRNFGSHAAIRAGLQVSSYDICTWMGADLQEPLDLLPKSYQKIKEGFDAVYIDKKSVGVSAFERIFSKAYSGLMRKFAVKNYSSSGTATIVFNKKIKDFLNQNVEHNSSITLQIIDAGFRFFTFSMDYGERSSGQSKWTLSKKIKLFIDSFVAFSFMPIRLVSLVGILVFLIGFLIGIITICNKIMNPTVPIGYSALASMMALGFGVTNISLGILAEYLWRAYDAARQRPVFIISEVRDLKKKTEEEGSVI